MALQVARPSPPQPLPQAVSPSAYPRFARPERLVFGLGAQKSGTSWLHIFLRSCPDVWLPAAQKELHYWTTIRPPHLPTGRQMLQRRLARVAAQPTGAGPAGGAKFLRKWQRALMRPSADHATYADVLFHNYRGEPVAGEITPAYALLGPDTLAEMAGLARDVRFVFLMRDPVSRLVSGVRHHLRDIGAEVTPAAVEAGVAAALDRPAGPDLRRSRYDLTLGALDAAGVPPGQVFCGFYERFFAQAEIERLCAFLGIAPQPADTGQRVNRGLSADIALPAGLQARARVALAPAYALVEQRFGVLPPGWAPPPAEG